MAKLYLHQINPCMQCGGETRRATTNQTFVFDDMTIIIEHVPTAICTQCGEEYVPGNVAREVGRVVREIAELERQRERELSMHARELTYDAEERFRDEATFAWVPA